MSDTKITTANIGDGTAVRVWISGEWTILHTRSVGQETTISLSAADAYRIAWAMSPEFEHRFDEYRAARDALYALSYPDTDVQYLEAAADRIDCGAECEHSSYDYSCNAHECSKQESKEGCSSEIATNLRDLAKALRTKATTPPAVDTAPAGEG